MADAPTQAAQHQGYGKSLAALIAGPISSAIVETADTYLPKPLPESAHDAIVVVVMLLAVYLVPHDVLDRLFGASP